MAVTAFVKVEGLGNDFILFDDMHNAADLAARDVAWLQRHAARLCDRRRGIGADGILLVGPGRSGTVASMTVVNADGSRPQMCGNGLRCVAAFVAARFDSEGVTIATDAGPRECRVDAAKVPTQVSIDMGPAKLLGKTTPKSGGGRSFVGVSVGNPHAVCFVDGGEDPETLARHYGPAVEVDGAYQPERTNVEFARREADGSLTLWVWERGVGITQACGTGACATAAAAVSEGLIPAGEPIRVALPGGSLTITVPAQADAGIRMVGPCRQVYSGVLDPASFTG